jgi:type IV secretory pathway VirB4 component
MLHLAATTVTTRHSPAAYPWQCQASLPEAGPVIGVDALASEHLFRYDPWECYEAGAISSPNAVVLGQLGKGKSSLVKTYLSRQLLAGRRAYILDPKGEYTPLANRRGLTRLALAPGGGDRLNPLDTAPGDSPASLARRRTAMTAALAATGLDRDLSPEERSGIGAAIADLGDAALLGDVVDRLLDPTASMATGLRTDPAALAGRVRDAALALRRLLADDLAGMVDGPTTIDRDPSGPGVVIDLSASFTADALAAIMVCAGAWLTALIATPEPARRILLVDEAWALLGAPATMRWLQQTSKLARRDGVQLVTVVHRLSDLSAQADAGTATARQAAGLLADAETRVVYTQSSAERGTAQSLLGLRDGEADLVCALPPYRALWLVGREAAVVDHWLSAAESDTVNTDERMRA